MSDKFVTVPLIPNAAMREVMEQEDWQWEDLLAAAGAITEDEYSEIAAASASPVPIDMILHCPKCGLQHVDEPEDAEVGHGHVHSAGWSNPPHRSHLCHGCGHIWRPADVPTNGVAAIKTKGKNDSPASPAQQIPDFAHELLEWNRAQPNPPIEIGREYAVADNIRKLLAPAQPQSIETERADFECWYVCRYKEPIGSDECARQWSAWLARSGGFYKAPSDWKISPKPWGRTDAAPAQQVEAAQPKESVAAICERLRAMRLGPCNNAADFIEWQAAQAPGKQEPLGWVKSSELQSSKLHGGSVNLWLKQFDCDTPVYAAPQPSHQQDQAQELDDERDEKVDIDFLIEQLQTTADYLHSRRKDVKGVAVRWAVRQIREVVKLLPQASCSDVKILAELASAKAEEAKWREQATALARTVMSDQTGAA